MFLNSFEAKTETFPGRHTFALMTTVNSHRSNIVTLLRCVLWQRQTLKTFISINAYGIPSTSTAVSTVHRHAMRTNSIKDPIRAVCLIKFVWWLFNLCRSISSSNSISRQQPKHCAISRRTKVRLLYFVPQHSAHAAMYALKMANCISGLQRKEKKK